MILSVHRGLSLSNPSLEGVGSVSSGAFGSTPQESIVQQTGLTNAQIVNARMTDLNVSGTISAKDISRVKAQPETALL